MIWWENVLDKNKSMQEKIWFPRLSTDKYDKTEGLVHGLKLVMLHCPLDTYLAFTHKICDVFKGFNILFTHRLEEVVSMTEV